LHRQSLIAECRKFGKALCALGVVNAVLGNKPAQFAKANWQSN
jgi:hypothetical protein